MNLSQRQKEIIVGTLLGDGYLEHDGFKASRLQIKQSERKKDYVLWLYNELKDLVRTPPKQRKDNNQWYFSTRSLVELDFFRNLFYWSGKKSVPSTIKELPFSSLSLAVWFMDDGSLDYRVKYHYSFSFSTDSFSEPDVRLLQELLFEKFGVKSNIQMVLCRGKKYTRLYVGKEGRDNFLSIVEPHILSCFDYKLPKLYLTPQRLNQTLLKSQVGV